jgi:uncharacterized protein (DUF433 family)
MENWDPRLEPAYSIAEAARILRLNAATVGAWAKGTTYGKGERRGQMQPVFEIAQKSPPSLSFMNLLEAHVLGAITRTHGVKLQKTRDALRFVAQHMNVSRPLLSQRFQTDGKDLFVEHLGHLVTASRAGQTVIEALTLRLARIEWDEEGLGRALYPFTRPQIQESAPRLIRIDATIAFGRPVIAGTGIPAAEVAERFRAGESIDELCADFSRSQAEIEESIRWVAETRAA